MIRTATCLAALTLVMGCATLPETAAPAGAAADDAEETGVLPVIPMTSAPLDREATITRIGVGSCLNSYEDQSIWRAIDASNPEIFLYIGDNVYGDVWSKDPMMPELRKAYRALARSEPFTTFRNKTPILPVWDDHDFGLNDAGGTYEFKYGGEAIFEEAWALPANDPRRMRDGVYFSETIGEEGQRVQIILLDTRFFRSDLKPTDERNAPGKERYLPDPDPAKTMLGDEQYAWLLEELQKPADLRLIVSSIQVIADGHGWEAWKTLPTDRQRFYDTINASGAEHVVLISGDRHAAALYKTEAATPYPLFEMTTSSMNLPASKWRAESGETRIEDGPNRLGTMEYEANFGQIDIDWDKGEVAMTILGADGSALQTVNVVFRDLEITD